MIFASKRWPHAAKPDIPCKERIPRYKPGHVPCKANMDLKFVAVKSLVLFAWLPIISRNYLTYCAPKIQPHAMLSYRSRECKKTAMPRNRTANTEVNPGAAMKYLPLHTDAPLQRHPCAVYRTCPVFRYLCRFRSTIIAFTNSLAAPFHPSKRLIWVVVHPIFGTALSARLHPVSKLFFRE